MGVAKLSFVLSLVLVSTVCAAAPPPDERDFLYSFLVGKYAFIGKNPDGGATYSGTAEIREAGEGLVLMKHMGATTIVAKGRIEHASPGEGKVVRFLWPGHGATCLALSDLDNYGRLSCYWWENGKAHKEPGLEAYFPTATWPE